MTNTVTICENALEPSTWQTFENVEDVRELLVQHFGIWPETAHIYLDYVANNADITPYDDAGIERLGKVNGHFFVVVYPNDPITIILVVIAVVVAAVSLALVFLFRPSASSPGQQQQSANNSLGQRENKARPNARIPDIFGTLQATFDLLAVPYRTFVANQELEHCYMCIGRGAYTIDSNTLCDAITRLNQTDGASVAVYAPNNSPNSGSPYLTIGPTISELIYNLQVFGSVNGQVLRAPNANTLVSGSQLAFQSPNQIINDGSLDFTQYFAVGDSIQINNTDGHGNGGHDNGYYAGKFLGSGYIVSAVTAGAISLTNPQLINPYWSSFSGTTPFHSGDNSTFAVITDTTIQWAPGGTLGKFFIANISITEFWCNFVCPQGAYWIDSGGNQYATNVTLRVGVTPADLNGNAAGIEQYFSVTVSGAANRRDQIGATLKIPLLGMNAGGGILVRAQRTSNTVVGNGISASDQTQWRDAYLISYVGAVNFGNVTTVQTVIRPTLTALAVKARKMNAVVTRNVAQWNGTDFTTLAAAPSKNAADILCAMALDPYIGNRTLAELDVVGIYAIAGITGTIVNYFNVLPDFTAPVEFCFTFDDSKVSFEEAVADLCTAIFCVGYRRGSVLTLSFEKQTPNSTLLFNHRNKIPGSETRSLTFGMLNNNDGITLDYIEPNAPNYPNVDTTVSLYFPTNKSAVNPKKVTTIGIRNSYQAILLGWRLYNKLIFQNSNVQFEATEEAALLVLQDRISVADNTRSDTQDGEITAQVSLLLTLSHNVVFDARFTYTIFIQHPDETVEAIPITAGSNPNQVILGFAPTLPCVIDPANYANTTYMIVSSAASAPTAFLLSEKTPKSGKVYELKCINYSDVYYAHDLDYKSAAEVDALFLEVMSNAPGPNVDEDGLYLEVMVTGPGSGGDVDGLYLEVMTQTLPPHVDEDGLYLEVMYH
jgi:hypothetical protein